jgi:hypothetical protein
VKLTYPLLTLDPPYHVLLQVITMPPKHNKKRKQSKEVKKKANEMEEDINGGDVFEDANVVEHSTGVVDVAGSQHSFPLGGVCRSSGDLSLGNSNETPPSLQVPNVQAMTVQEIKEELQCLNVSTNLKKARKIYKIFSGTLTSRRSPKRTIKQYHKYQDCV